MSALGDSLRVALADTFAFYLKAHNFHWNVEGIDFYEYHIFFEQIYNEVWEAVDAVAEHLRTLDEYAPGSFSRFSELTNVKDAVSIPEGRVMAHILYNDNQLVIASLEATQKMAEEEKKVGLSNFLQDRIDRHEKHGWMLRSTIKNRL